MRNFISFDLEFWYDSEFIKDKKKSEKKNDLISEGIKRITRILDVHNIRATFFVTGEVIEKYPDVIKKLSKEGHEIASHGYKHVMLNKLNKEKFKEELGLSKELIKKITGKNPLGFRAPCWSISKNEFWVYKILHDLGFKYSSSLFPINTGLYGSSKFPVSPFKPIKNSNLIEIPVRPFEIGKLRIPFSGGVYFRCFSAKQINFFMKKTNERKQEVILHLHPWEFCPEIPQVKTSLVGKVTTYWGIKNNEEKLDNILSRFKFGTFRDLIVEKINV